MNEKDLKRARTIAFRLLKYRIRSQKELETRLKIKKIPADTIKVVIGDLKRLSLVDDRAFTRAWIQDRIRRGYGTVRIKKELREKGIDPEVISEGIAAFGKEAQSPAVIQRLIERRLRRYRTDDIVLIKRKLFSYLGARGFPVDQIRQALEDLGRPDDNQ